MSILAIDPGNLESAFVLLNDDLTVIDKDKVDNDILLEVMWDYIQENKSDWKDKENFHVVIEMVASYGMAVGKTTFDTVFWIGRFYQKAFSMGFLPTLIYRKDEKINLCNSMKAKDSNIRQALIDRFGIVGTKRSPGFFYGFKADIWAAMAVATTYHDMYLVTEKANKIYNK